MKIKPIDDHEYWKKRSYWTLEQAVFLLLGFDPDIYDPVEMTPVPGTKPPKPYDEIHRLMRLVQDAIRAGELPEDWRPSDFIKWALEEKLPMPYDLEELKQQGGYSAREIPYLNPQHEYYSLELAAAVDAWTALYSDGGYKNKFSHKSQIEDYLRKRNPQLSDRAIERLATIVNPRKSGGAPPTE